MGSTSFSLPSPATLKTLQVCREEKKGEKEYVGQNHQTRRKLMRFAPVVELEKGSEESKGVLLRLRLTVCFVLV